MKSGDHQCGATAVKTATNPGGLPKEVFDGFRPNSPPTEPSSVTMCRLERSMDNRPGAKPSQGVIWFGGARV